MPTIATLLASAWPCRAIRLVLAAAFLAAGAVKLADVHAFVLTIKAFAILPTDVVKPMAVLLPILEILAAGLVLVRPRAGLLLVGGLLLLFIGVAGNAIRQGLALDCGCYGPGDPEGAVYHGLWPTVWRDGAMLAGVAFCLLRPAARPAPSP
uniref:Methylamine utilization protein MauE n=1 Tax=Desulfovibrio sp. U5L TaxID=596152 RepID=I2Q4Y1_9BACT